MAVLKRLDIFGYYLIFIAISALMPLIDKDTKNPFNTYRSQGRLESNIYRAF